jgi:kynurenine formamidase
MIGVRPHNRANWGRFGDGDEIGALNYATDEAARAAGSQILTGERFTLKLPLDLPRRRTGVRQDLRKVTHMRNAQREGGAVVNDDHIVLYTQGSSQWDAFAHVGLVEPGEDGVFYNGAAPESVDFDGCASRCSIEPIAARGIVGQGVLADVAPFVANGADDRLPNTHAVTAEELSACLDWQDVAVEPGDIVCVPTGWIERYLAADDDERARLIDADTVRKGNPGITLGCARLAEEQRWSAACGDNIGLEVLPFRPDYSASIHVAFLRDLGIPIGEMLVFEDLARACARDRRRSFFFVAVPLRVPGGFGSPANAIAIR